jgi:hypothetical protein
MRLMRQILIDTGDHQIARLRREFTRCCRKSGSKARRVESLGFGAGLRIDDHEFEPVVAVAPIPKHVSAGNPARRDHRVADFSTKRRVENTRRPIVVRGAEVPRRGDRSRLPADIRHGLPRMKASANHESSDNQPASHQRTASIHDVPPKHGVDGFVRYWPMLSKKSKIERLPKSRRRSVFSCLRYCKPQ